jgi:hypothetical protein
MALFNLTDIAYKRGEERNFTPFNKMQSENTGKYLGLMRYPIDLGSTDKGHYMLIHINVQEKTSYQANFDEGVLPTIQRNRIGLRSQTGATNLGGITASGGDVLSRVGSFVGARTPEVIKRETEKALAGLSSFLVNKYESAKSNIGGDDMAVIERGLQTAKDFGVGVKKGTEQLVGNLNNTSFLRTVKRTTETIALYMPGTMAYTQNQQYNQLQMGGEPAAFYGAGFSLINDAVNGKVSPEQLGKNLTPFIAEKIKNFASPIIGTNSASALFASAIGGVQNPQLELIYTSPSFRSFRFDFMFYPSSEAEAQEVQNIIQSLKFHQAPEIMTGTAGYFLVPPSEFDIEFYYNGEVNPNIPKISTCVLTSIDMDYAPKGFVAYEVPGENNPSLGRTGMPFAIRLSLSFQETEIMTKYNFQDGRKLK